MVGLTVRDTRKDFVRTDGGYTGGVGRSVTSDGGRRLALYSTTPRPV